MIPEIKVKHWKWCETQGNSPHEKWEWCEVNEEVDVYTALWLIDEELIDMDDYINKLGETDFAKWLLVPQSIKGRFFITDPFDDNGLTEEGHDMLNAFLQGLAFNHTFDIDENIYTNESL